MVSSYVRYISGNLHMNTENGACSTGCSRAGKISTAFALLGILCVAFYFRTLVGLNWDEDQHLHPDERFLTMVTEALKVPPSLTDYFNSSTSTLSPYNRNFGFFVYGTLPIFLTKYIATATGLEGYGQVHLVGRVISSLFDLLTLLVVFLLGKRLFNRATGLVAATLFALVPQNLQLSHFYNVENSTGFFAALSLLLSTELLLPPQPRPACSLRGRGIAAALPLVLFAILFCSGLPVYVAVLITILTTAVAAALILHASAPIMLRCILLGITLGATLASKVSAAYLVPFVGIPFAVALAQAAARALGAKVSGHPNTSSAPSALQLLVGGGLVGLFAALTFRTWQPYAFEGTTILSFSLAPSFLSNMREIRAQMSGADMPPGVYWVGQPPFVFHWSNMIWWQMGLGWFLAAWLGLIAVGWRTLKQLAVESLPWLTWTLFWFTFTTMGYAKAGRYLSTIYPFFALAGAYLLVAMTQTIRRSLIVDGLQPLHARVAAAVPAGIVLLSALLWAVAITNIYRRPHTRIAASRWIYQNIPCGSSIGVEHWDDGLPLRVDGKDGYGGCYKGVEFENYHWDDAKKLASMLTKLKTADYIVLSSNRLYGSIPRMPRRFPFTIEYYRMLFSGELGFALEKIFSSYPSLGGLTFNDDAREELILNYDHPKVLVFKKTASFNPEYIAARLSAFAPNVPVTQLDQQR